jgi:DNA-binding NarL/FixJ family response regulator
MAIKVAIVEDDTKVRGSIAMLINGAPGYTCAASYPNAEAALKQIPSDAPDIVLMDINLPQMSGIECAAKLKAARKSLLIVMLTSYEDSELIFQSLRAGASGYLLKRSTPSEILEALNDVHRGGSPMSSSIARKVVDYFQREAAAGVRGAAQTPPEGSNLSEREVEILGWLAQGYQYKEIGDKLSISAFTVRNHLRNICEKLQVRSRTEAIVKFLNKEFSR